MSLYKIDTYGNAFSDNYDKTYDDFIPSVDQINYIKELAKNDIALEVGIGTGRIAVPLSKSGTKVAGYDPSTLMLDILKTKDESKNIKFFHGKIEDTKKHIQENIGVIYAPFNVFFLMEKNKEQTEFFIHASNILASRGYLVIECFVPNYNTRLVDGENPAFFPLGKHLEIRSIDSDKVIILASENSPEDKVWHLNEIILQDSKLIKIIPATLSYMTHDEIDMLAEQAGFEVVSRWESWGKENFSLASKKHITTYQLKKEVLK